MEICDEGSFMEKNYTYQVMRKNNQINDNSPPNFNQIIEPILQHEYYT